MRLRLHWSLIGLFLLGAATAQAQEEEKEKKVSFFYAEDFLTCTGVDAGTGLFTNPQDTFNVIRDEAVYAWLSLKFIPKESQTVQFVWYDPRGDQYHESKVVTVNDEEYFRKYARVWEQIGIRDLDKLGLLGEWRVIAKVDGKSIDKEARFTLVR